MQTFFLVPAEYVPFLERAIVRALDEVQRDRSYRADTDEQIRRWASVPDALIDRSLKGPALIGVNVNTTNAPSFAASASLIMGGAA